MSKQAEVSESREGRFSQWADNTFKAIYTLKIGDRDSSQDELFRSAIDKISLTERISGSDTLTLTLNDPYFGTKDSIIDTCIIDVKTTKVVLKYSWTTNSSSNIQGVKNVRTFIGYVSALDIDFPNTGVPNLTVTCLDYATHDMNVNKYTKTWQNVTSKDVVESIAKRYGYATEIENYEFKKRDTIGQSHQTDIEFLEHLASNEFEQFICKVQTSIKDGKEITVIKYIKKRVDKDAVAGFRYKEKPFDIISFNPQLNRETKKEKIRGSNISTNSKTVFNAFANSGEVPRSSEKGVTWDNSKSMEVKET